MKTIWKYELQIVDEQVLEMPRMAVPLSVKLQYGVACLWAEVDSSEKTERRKVFCCGTGNPMKDMTECLFIGTVIQGQFVWHFYIER